MGRDNFDDSYIVTGGRKPHCTVRQDSSSAIVVSGSAKHFLDPRMNAERTLLDLLRAAHTERFTPPPGYAWCSDCGDWRPKGYFPPDVRNLSGVGSICHSCDAARKRQAYAAKVGRPVRSYRRKTA